jgi:hypothetical protein
MLPVPSAIDRPVDHQIAAVAISIAVVSLVGRAARANFQYKGSR